MNKKLIEELKKKFFGDSIEDLNIEYIMELKRKNIPKKLFKYRNVNEYSKQNLKTDTVWCTNAANFNDPYDSSLCFSFDDNFMDSVLIESIQQSINENPQNHLSDMNIDMLKNSKNPMRFLLEHGALKDPDVSPEMVDKLESFFKEFGKKEIKNMNKEFNRGLKNGYKICSFSERVDSILMWSHYAENHTGFVMEYSFSDLPSKEIIPRLLWPVLYDDKLYNISSQFTELRNNGSLNNFHAQIAAMHKAKDWSYENEWRLILPLSPSDPPQNYKVPIPKGVYLGSLMSDKHKSEIKEIAEEKGIPVYQMKLSHDRFEMVFE